MEVIELDNNYYLEVSNNKKNMDNIVDIKGMNIKNIKGKNVIVLKIDFSTFANEDYKKLLKKLLYARSILTKRKIEIGVSKDSKILLGYVYNYDKANKIHNDFICGINAVFYNDRYDRYNYIYEVVCDHLDKSFYGKNLCDFRNNKCVEKRDTDSVIGCCRHYKIKLLGPLSKFVPCEYLKEDYTCGAKCISCKLFTCDYLKNKGIEFKIKDILLIDTFFNPIQKYFIKYMVYTPKEKIIKRLVYLSTY